MKKYMDKLKKRIHLNKKLFIFLLFIVIVGIISGSLFLIIMDNGDKKMVYDYLSDFFSNTKNGKLNYDVSLNNSLIISVGMLLLIWLLGFSIIGFFIILFILFLKGFILGFILSSLVFHFKFKGILLSIIYVLPHQPINLLILMLVSGYALIISFKLIKCVVSKTSLNFKGIMNRYIIVFLVCLIVLILTSLYEVYIMPKILSIILRL